MSCQNGISNSGNEYKKISDAALSGLNTYVDDLNKRGFTSLILARVYGELFVKLMF